MVLKREQNFSSSDVDGLLLGGQQAVHGRRHGLHVNLSETQPQLRKALLEMAEKAKKKQQNPPPLKTS